MGLKPYWRDYCMVSLVLVHNNDIIQLNVNVNYIT